MLFLYCGENYIIGTSLCGSGNAGKTATTNAPPF